jgi:2-dehydro-3-deoxygluconokinase
MKIRPKSETKFDFASLGSTMLRINTGRMPIRHAETCTLNHGGGETNVTEGACRVFKQRGAILSASVKSEVGELLDAKWRSSGASTEHVKWFDYQATTGPRIGINFVDEGFGIRSVKGVSDRSNEAAGFLKPSDFDFEKIFGEQGVRVLVIGGIFLGLSQGTTEVVKAAVEIAKKYGTIIACDLNYRATLWDDRGGEKAAHKVMREIVPLVDVLFGNHSDYNKALGYTFPEREKPKDWAMYTEDQRRAWQISHEPFEEVIDKVRVDFPQPSVFATNIRKELDTSTHAWTGSMWHDGTFHRAPMILDLKVMDRVGGGDSFASGLLYGLLEGMEPADWLKCGWAHGALKATCPGDVSLVSLADVKRVMEGGSAEMVR